MASTGCGRLHFDPLGTDGATGDIGPACSTFGPWSAPVPIPNVNSTLQDAGPALSADLTELYFHSNRDSVDFNVYVARRASRNDDFGVPQPVAALSSPNDEENPTLSSDGLTMYLTLKAALTKLYKATRSTTADEFGAPINLTELNFIDVHGPTLGSHGDELFFSTGSNGNEQMQRAVLGPGGTWSLVGAVTELSVLGNAGYPSLGAGDTALAFEGSQTVGGPTYVYGATRQSDGTFTAIAPIDEINAGGTGDENDPEISRDGTTMVFSSGRPGSLDLDLYMSTRGCM
jgi:hypothetical protein